MGINCPSCGGKMVFDIAEQQLKCEFCNSRLTIQKYKSNNEGETQQMTYDTVVYTCRNCGAELTAPDEQAVAYCSYCGSEQMLSAKHEQALRPKNIIPFKKTKEQAMEQYAKALKGKFYVPKEFKDPNFLEGFRGIYLPYFSYNTLVADRQVQFEGTASYTKGGYDYTETYRVDTHLGGHSSDVNFDASSAFDDTLANEIAPFNAKDMREFHEGYLAGLYADKATTDERTYLQQATELAVDSVYKEINRKAGKAKIKEEKDPEMRKAQVGISAVDCEVSYFPVWFLTWRHKKRVAYSVMNGQTGKIAVDIPVNKTTFFLISLAAAVLVFAALCFLPMFILPKTISGIAAIILVISSILLRREIKKIYVRESHIYDYGDTQHKAKKKITKAKESSAYIASNAPVKKKSLGLIGVIIPAFYVVIYIAFAALKGVSLLETIFSGGGSAVYFLAMLVQLPFTVFTIIHAVQIEKKSAIIPAILAPAALAFGIFAHSLNSPYDFWYYGAALACLAAMIINCLSCINYFNYLTTRPVPNFFRREGANNAK
ncbi:MAG: hypothetical protein IKZ95_07800 [Lachnospiraceae bacterium]|nr:hypothetical protein [Lachnospiraceae bacterium]